MPEYGLDRECLTSLGVEYPNPRCHEREKNCSTRFSAEQTQADRDGARSCASNLSQIARPLISFPHSTASRSAISQHLGPGTGPDDPRSPLGISPAGKIAVTTHAKSSLRDGRTSLLPLGFAGFLIPPSVRQRERDRPPEWLPQSRGG